MSWKEIAAEAINKERKTKEEREIRLQMSKERLSVELDEVVDLSGIEELLYEINETPEWASNGKLSSYRFSNTEWSFGRSVSLRSERVVPTSFEKVPITEKVKERRYIPNVVWGGNDGAEKLYAGGGVWVNKKVDKVVGWDTKTTPSHTAVDKLIVIGFELCPGFRLELKLQGVTGFKRFCENRLRTNGYDTHVISRSVVLDVHGVSTGSWITFKFARDIKTGSLTQVIPDVQEIFARVLARTQLAGEEF